jgi:hypothetical protein
MGRVRASVAATVMMPKILYINTHAARYGWYFGHRMPKGYRLAARFWGSGLIDRTRTLHTGFPTRIIYPIPQFIPNGTVGAGSNLSSLCDERARKILQEAIDTQREIEVLWSGGIDSTAALVATIKAATALGATQQLEVLLTNESIDEYPTFYNRFVKPLRHRFVSAPVTSYLNPSRLIITGEFGDQIFGSAKAEKYVQDGRAFETYNSTFGPILTEALGSRVKADIVLEYVEPLLHACPIALRTIFDAFWWINFSLKWQIVGLRLAVFRVSDVRQTFEALRHFFSDPSFQTWSFQNHNVKIQGSWETYKMPLKEYIFAFTGDDEYRRTKVKMASLRAVFLTDTMHRPPKYRVLMDEKFEPVFWLFQEGSGDQAAFKLPRRNRGR